MSSRSFILAIIKECGIELKAFLKSMKAQCGGLGSDALCYMS